MRRSRIATRYIKDWGTRPGGLLILTSQRLVFLPDALTTRLEKLVPGARWSVPLAVIETVDAGRILGMVRVELHEGTVHRFGLWKAHECVKELRRAIGGSEHH